MLRIIRKCQYTILLGLLLVTASPAWSDEPKWSFKLQSSPSVHQTPFTGRVYVFLKPADQRDRKEPKSGPDWFQPQPMIAMDVTNWKPGEELVLDLDNPAVLKFPKDLNAEMIRWTNAQAVVRAHPEEREVGDGPGNWYSQVVTLQNPTAVTFQLNRVVPSPQFPETAWTKLLRVRSELLSQFHQRDIFLNGAVTLPASYFSQPGRRYPVIYEIPGFSGSHFHGVHRQPVRETNRLGVEFIRVMLDPNCQLGHHVFANSANNGPCMDALLQEFIPAMDAAYRTDARPEGRFLTGHSSGGWASLWLMINAPDQFAGTWSTAPDSVSFRDFQLINLYRDGENMFHDENGQRRPIVRLRNRPVVYYDTFSNMEDVLGHGCQLQSFEAVFSPKAANGEPAKLWNRETGAIDPEVVEAWKKYDILMLLEENWETLEPKLRGKLHVFMGTEDTFYLDGATRLMQQSLQQLGSDAHIELIPGRDHMNLFVGGLDQRINQEMAAKYREAPAQNLQNSPGSTMVK
ncbi:alpha/beta hydrolase-fold protein [Planctomicrobium sp. SH661]|uniref:alpha/beta hydrolase-fold protein n=1 Tax=Planctomicrobium sp. SH661 TaxID=3448124 RepID=UPI003F5BA91C